MFNLSNKINFLYKDVVIHTEPMKTLPLLMKQRKRWINGSWFAREEIYEAFCGRIFGTNHNWIRKFIFHLFILFKVLMRVNQYLMISFVFVIMFIICEELFGNYYVADMPLMNLSLMFMVYFVSLFVLLFHLSILFKPHQAIFHFELISHIFSITFQGILFFLIYKLFFFIFLDNANNIDFQYTEYINQEHIWIWNDKKFILLFIAIIVVKIFLPMIFNPFVFLKIILKSISYFYNYTILTIFMQIYAFCNIGDLTWGTKNNQTKAYFPLNHLEEKNKFESNFQTRWIVLNIFIIILVSLANSNEEIRRWCILGLCTYFAFCGIFKLLFSIIHKMKYYLLDKFYFWIIFKFNESNYKKRKLIIDG